MTEVHASETATAHLNPLETFIDVWTLGGLLAGELPLGLMVRLGISILSLGAKPGVESTGHVFGFPPGRRLYFLGSVQTEYISIADSCTKRLCGTKTGIEG